MPKKKTFVDANVLIAAFQGKVEISEKALMILDDPEREFIVSDYLRLEVIPKPRFHRKQEEVEFMEAFFESASEEVGSTPTLTLQAIELASNHDLHPLDALHVSVAVQADADEFITGEKESKPLFRVDNLTVKSLLF
ncbi:MAG: PIN domain-containing protein [Syntrophaceae bacterium]|nr:PIN domain-containing protein [Syntrophaceae bacterium]